jgi:CheY-like chemotaxis protein
MSEGLPSSDGPKRFAGPTLRTAAARPLGGLHVLVVDDDPDIRDVLTLMFELAGARVTGCGDGFQALDALQADVPDVLVMDINLPGPDGFNVMNRIRQLHDPAARAVPAIALSGSIEEFGVDRIVDAGFTEWFGKPGSGEQLVEAVARLAGRAT